MPSAEVRVRVPRSATSPVRGGAGGRLSWSWHMPRFYRRPPSRPPGQPSAASSAARVAAEHLGGDLAAGLGSQSYCRLAWLDEPVELAGVQPRVDLGDLAQRLEAAALAPDGRGEELELDQVATAVSGDSRRPLSLARESFSPTHSGHLLVLAGPGSPAPRIERLQRGLLLAQLAEQLLERPLVVGRPVLAEHPADQLDAAGRGGQVVVAVDARAGRGCGCRRTGTTRTRCLLAGRATTADWPILRAAGCPRARGQRRSSTTQPTQPAAHSGLARVPMMNRSAAAGRLELGVAAQALHGDEDGQPLRPAGQQRAGHGRPVPGPRPRRRRAAPPGRRDHRRPPPTVGSAARSTAVATGPPPATAASAPTTVATLQRPRRRRAAGPGQHRGDRRAARPAGPRPTRAASAPRRRSATRPPAAAAASSTSDATITNAPGSSGGPGQQPGGGGPQLPLELPRPGGQPLPHRLPGDAQLGRGLRLRPAGVDQVDRPPRPASLRRSSSPASALSTACASAASAGAAPRTASRAGRCLAASTARRALRNAGPVAARVLSGSGVCTGPAPTPMLQPPSRTSAHDDVDHRGRVVEHTLELVTGGPLEPEHDGGRAAQPRQRVGDPVGAAPAGALVDGQHEGHCARLTAFIGESKAHGLSGLDARAGSRRSRSGPSR